MVPSLESNPGSFSTSSSLIERVRSNDSAAWERFVDLYGPLTYSWARRYGFQSYDAADVMQETLIAVSRAIDQFDPANHGSSFRGWLWAIARNKMRDAWRRKESAAAAGGTEARLLLEQATDQLPEDDPTEKLAWKHLLMRALSNVRAEFEDRTWRAFWRVAVDGLSAVDVAQELGMSAAAVRQAKCRITRRLREELGEF
jgi:RNA polymerase sigma-70 factor (ECF subfamily)